MMIANNNLNKENDRTVETAMMSGVSDAVDFNKDESFSPQTEKIETL